MSEIPETKLDKFMRDVFFPAVLMVLTACAVSFVGTAIVSSYGEPLKLRLETMERESERRQRELEDLQRNIEDELKRAKSPAAPAFDLEKAMEWLREEPRPKGG